MRDADVARKVGENLSYTRRRARLSQEEIGVRASLHRTEVGMLERGERLPRVDTLLKVAGALEVPPSELLKGIDWSPGSAVVGRWTVSVEGD